MCGRVGCASLAAMMYEIKCRRCGRQLTVWEATSKSSVVHDGNDKDGYVAHRWCGVCQYRYADPEDYGKPRLWKRLHIMWQRWWEPKVQPSDVVEDDDPHMHWSG